MSVALASCFGPPSNERNTVRIDSFTIGATAPAFLIAEIGLNHNGSLDLAKQLVDRAIWAGADCAKFQMRDLAHLYANGGDPNDSREDLGSQYVLDVLAKSQLSTEQMFELFSYCRERGILALCTPWDAPSVQALEAYGMVAYKVASADLTNADLLDLIAATGKPMIVSTGMSTEAEIEGAVALLQARRASYVLLHCVSTYPAPFKDVNLRYLDRLRTLGDCPVGYSGHERGYVIALAAVARGAKVIEKHITLNKELEGNDHKVSLLPEEFRAMAQSIRQIESALGADGPRILGQGERMNRETLAKSLVASRPIAAGEIISAEAVAVRSPGKGLQPNRRNELIGRRANRDIANGEFFFPADLDEASVNARTYRFRRPFGIPVRYHDFAALHSLSKPDFVEFHLSFKDLDQAPDRFLTGTYDCDLVVHSPDLFAGDHLLNLADLDDSRWRRSIAELRRVVELTRGLKRYFRPKARTLLVASLGGFTRDHPLPIAARPALYDRVAAALAEIDTEDVEIIAQTLPPFPWYLGGQLYCNLFVDPADTHAFCESHGYRLCLDVAHSKLAANYRGSSLSALVEQVGPHVAHLHIVDATGVDGEGLQIGEGEIDFAALAAQLDRLAPRAGFIPEIWQGHKNQGEGFWIALDRLETWF